MNGPQDRPQAPQRPVPAGDALGPPDTHTDVQSVSVRVAEERAASLLQARLSWPAAEGCARDLAWAGLLCTPAERALIDAALAMREYDLLVQAGKRSASAGYVLMLIAAADRVLADREDRS